MLSVTEFPTPCKRILFICALMHVASRNVLFAHLKAAGEHGYFMDYGTPNAYLFVKFKFKGIYRAPFSFFETDYLKGRVSR